METGIRHRITVLQSVAVIVGIVIGAGIFRTPPLVAANTDSAGMFMGVWLLGGMISFIGALCYAELATAYPHEGGDYIYLRRSFGPMASFLFVWSRMTVIQTGSIALLAFIIGDYATIILPFGTLSAPIYAALSILVLTILNMSSVRRGYNTQMILLLLVLGSMTLVSIAGMFFTGQPAPNPIPVVPITANIGGALIFVLLTYGGWTEAAFISRELKNNHHAMIRSLVLSIGIITVLYLVTNYAYLRSFGLEGLRSSEAVGAELMERTFGRSGSILFAFIIIGIALSTMNGVMITGARSNYALGRDYQAFSLLGRLSDRDGNPTAAYLVQGGVALLLIGMGAFTRDGFALMVDYTAPVFWLFILLTGISLFILRKRDETRTRPFRVPGYPLTPLLFCLSAAYMLYSSVVYTGIGGLTGLAVLASGFIFYLFVHAADDMGAAAEHNA